jgi:chromate reductase, NAD(P)H dehydrogenase (quinone)
MSTNRDVAVLVGSLRKQSYNRKVALALPELAPASLKLQLVEIGQLSLYNADDEGPVDILAPGPALQNLGLPPGANPLTADEERILRMRFGVGGNATTPEREPAFMAWGRLRRQIKAVDAVLFVTPEYSRSVPGVLKNALDIASRPYGQNAWQGKPGAVISVSHAVLGGFGANHHLRQSLVALDMPAMQQPEAYIGRADTLFDKGSGELTHEGTRERLSTFMRAFAAWIEIHAKPARDADHA